MLKRKTRMKTGDTASITIKILLIISNLINVNVQVLLLALKNKLSYKKILNLTYNRCI